MNCLTSWPSPGTPSPMGQGCQEGPLGGQTPAHTTGRGGRKPRPWQACPRLGLRSDFTTVFEANSQNPDTPIFLKYKLKMHSSAKNNDSSFSTAPGCKSRVTYTPERLKPGEPEKLQCFPNSWCRYTARPGPARPSPAQPAAILGDPLLSERGCSPYPPLLTPLRGGGNRK